MAAKNGYHELTAQDISLNWVCLTSTSERFSVHRSARRSGAPGQDGAVRMEDIFDTVAFHRVIES
jgi:hypothetical protein